MKRIAVFLGVVAISIFAITWLAPSAPASEKTQRGQVHVQALMHNAHDLTETTPSALY
jgi:type II secretory pathway component PulM